MSALTTAVGKTFCGKFTVEINFLIGFFYIIIADPDVGSLKSLHTVFDKYLVHMLVKFEQNCMVQTIQKFELFDKKWLTIFDNVLTPF